jgi:peptidoglycan/LPS O-acetylase OafA/YrhL
MTSAKDVMDRHGGLGPGFDLWRFSLSTLVMVLHTFIVCYGVNSEIAHKVGSIGRPVFTALLPIFFGLSGFLVAGSALRTNIPRFFLNRALRLVPALAVETTLAALILGPIVTTVALTDYFTTREFFAYFGNIVGRVRYELPGVFEANPHPKIVNMNLWTLHAELECYAIMMAAMLLGFVNRRRIALGLWVAVTVALIIWNALTGQFEPPAVLYPTPVFVYSFCTGVIAYLWRDWIPINRAPLLVVAGAYVVLVYLPQTVFVNVILLTYVMIYVGVTPQRSFDAIARGGDYSYGIYLYGFVIQQTVYLLLPWVREWWLHFPVSFALTLAFAVASWHVIEKPALRLKHWRTKPSRSIAPASAL